MEHFSGERLRFLLTINQELSAQRFIETKLHLIFIYVSFFFLSYLIISQALTFRAHTYTPWFELYSIQLARWERAHFFFVCEIHFFSIFMQLASKAPDGISFKSIFALRELNACCKVELVLSDFHICMCCVYFAVHFWSWIETGKWIQWTYTVEIHNSMLHWCIICPHWNMSVSLVWIVPIVLLNMVAMCTVLMWFNKATQNCGEYNHSETL